MSKFQSPVRRRQVMMPGQNRGRGCYATLPQRRRRGCGRGNPCGCPIRWCQRSGRGIYDVCSTITC